MNHSFVHHLHDLVFLSYVYVYNLIINLEPGPSPYQAVETSQPGFKAQLEARTQPVSSSKTMKSTTPTS